MHSVQLSDTTVEGKKCPPRQSAATLHLEVLSDLKEIKAAIVLLKDLKAEVSQIRESMNKICMAALYGICMAAKIQKTSITGPIFSHSTGRGATSVQRLTSICPVTWSVATNPPTIHGSTRGRPSSREASHRSGTQHHVHDPGVPDAVGEEKSSASIATGVGAVSTSAQDAGGLCHPTAHETSL